MDAEVKKNLQKWGELKFGLMMHWGPYSQWGAVESWSICSEDEDWCRRDRDNYYEYVKAYRELQKTFNPVEFNPDEWAQMAADAGMKYVVSTTKHHDGFCMYDTKQTDYKITSSACPFSSNAKSDVTKEIFKSFREKDFMTGAYFSKPDWDCEYYWWPYFATPDRHVNYNPAKYPDRWNRFKEFTKNQIEELMTGYGRIDILWLDGAWIRPIGNKLPKEYECWAVKNDWDQDIDIGGIAAAARRHQPGLIIVDRWVKGEFEDYQTPEQKIPDELLDGPWESCITMSDGWSYNPNDNYKSTGQLIRMLVEIVAKGGNFLLNVAPTPEGRFPEQAVERLKEIGEWMKINGEAIYETRPVKPYKKGNVCYTSKADGIVYAIYLAKENEALPAKVVLENFVPAEGSVITMQGNDQTLKWSKKADGIVIETNPNSIGPASDHAWVFKMQGI